jgi:predicted nucleic acid-binding protein
MINVIDSVDFKAQKGENYFFDNNIWMYLFCPFGSFNATIQKKCSRVLNQIKSIKGNILTNNLIISEFANAYIKYEYNIWEKNQPEDKCDYKKNFRLTDNYHQTQTLINESIQRILKLSSFTDDNFLNIDIENVLEKIGVIDFNDAYYLELCNQKKYTLVSNDKDFLKVDLNIDLIKI